uniref:ARAD1D00154p n=1 Tax=Blastobotrys adeninivorans TaxID=409370 RepID=A0A060T7K4_BLAAD
MYFCYSWEYISKHCEDSYKIPPKRVRLYEEIPLMAEGRSGVFHARYPDARIWCTTIFEPKRGVNGARMVSLYLLDLEEQDGCIFGKVEGIFQENIGDEC